VDTDTAPGFGEVLRGLRVAAGLNQEELAERAGLSAHGISDLERGARTRPYPATIRRLAAALGLSAEELAALKAASRVASAPATSLAQRAENRPAEGPIEVSAPDQPAVNETPMVGRDAELQRILSILEGAVTARRGRLVLLRGEPGVGKTRMAREVLARAGSLRIRGFIGRCFEQHTAVPFFPFTEALMLPLAGQPLLAVPQALERWPELEHLLPDAGLHHRVQGEDDLQLRVFRAVTMSLRDAAEASGLVLLLDDLHWADATSLSLLLYLSRHLESSRVLLLGTYRDSEVDGDKAFAETLRELARQRLIDEVRVRPLTLNGTAELVHHQLASQPVSDELVALVHARAGGNPFFTEELVQALLEQDGRAESQPHLAGGAPLELEVPHSVRSVVEHRVSRLPRETQELLRLASVVGQEVQLNVLVQASGRSEADVLDHLDAALAAGLLKEAHGGRTPYVFVHALAQEALYAGLPSSVRRRLHLSIGEVLERQQPGRPLITADLARHFLAARDAKRAVGYALQAGREASARYAHAEAVRWYQKSVDLFVDTGDQARAADARYRLASELYYLNQLPDALGAYQEALDSFEQLGDMLGQARVHWGIGLVHRGRYDLTAAMPHFQAALRLWPADREDAELASLQVDAARASNFSGDFSMARSLAARAADVAARSNAPSLLAQSLILLALGRFQDDPRPKVMLEPLDRAERAALAAAEWRALSYVYVTRASYCGCLSGQFDRALADRRAAIDAAQRSGDTERLSFTYRMMASDHLDMGAWLEGREAMRKGIALDPVGALKGYPDSALLTWMEGRPHDALAQIAAYVAEARPRHDLQGLSIGLTAVSEMALQVNRVAEAESAAREAADLLRIGGRWTPWPGNGWPPLAETLVRLATPDAEEILARAEHEVAVSEQYVGRPQLLRARGLMLQRQGHIDVALEAFAASAEIARSQGAGIQLGRTLNALVALAQQRGDSVLAVETEKELVGLIEQIGPEVTALSWAQRDVAGLSSPPFR
jgi:transcriptional regulator with XRE-family HTH domain/tetratricopeptide (TPR) repeat protein